MTAKDVFTFIIIHLIVPLIGLIFFIALIKKMKRENVVDAPTFELFIVFSTCSGVLVALTTLFWQWSGMASLGTFYLILAAPIAMGIIAYRNRKTKNNSKYHKWV